MKRLQTESFATSRRDFLKMVAVAGAGLTLGLRLPEAEAMDAPATSDAGSFEPNAFVRIGTDNKVTVIIKHLEMGQGTYTGLATLVAEELDAAWDQIVAAPAPANSELYKNLHWGSQGTGGSSAIANSFEQMRNAGAAAKMMLVSAASEEWDVPAEEITVSQGVVSHAASKNSARFGDLAKQAAKQPVPIPEDINLKDPKDFVFIGKQTLSRKDVGKTDGTAMFTQDVKLPNMLTAVVAHSPRFGGKVASFDATAAKAVAGVVDVVQIPSGVAVLAKDFWTAQKGRNALKIEWDDSQAFKQSSEEIMAHFKAVAKTTGAVARKDGDSAAALAKADKVLEASYEFPFLAHATMEPMNCVANKCKPTTKPWLPLPWD